MNCFLRLIRTIGPRRKFSSSRNDPVSVILLLKEARFKTAGELAEAGERAWGIPFSDESDSKHFVFKKGNFLVLSAGTHKFNILHFSRPFIDDKNQFKEIAQSWKTQEQRDAWISQRACVILDYLTGGKDFEVEYGALTWFASEIVDQNCSGVFIPGESLLLPSNEHLRENLRSFAGDRHLAANTIG